MVDQQTLSLDGVTVQSITQSYCHTVIRFGAFSLNRNLYQHFFIRHFINLLVVQSPDSPPFNAAETFLAKINVKHFLPSFYSLLISPDMSNISSFVNVKEFWVQNTFRMTDM